MPAVYPSTPQTFEPKVDNVSPVIAADVNLAYLEITAIETTLGTNPAVSTWSGSFDQATTNWGTVRDRITNIEKGLNVAYNDRVKSTGGSTIANSSSVALTLQTSLLATSNLLEVKDSGGTVRTAINSSGYIVAISGGTP